jgi:urease accessory protein
MEPVKLGIGGPVGSGKTCLIDRLTRRLVNQYKLGVITNDIYTKEDAKFLIEKGILEPEQIIGVETGGCPHTAIREDASMNFAAIEEMKTRFADLELIIIESGGDNLAATFSPELVDAYIYVIAVSEGGDIPRKRGAGITHSDLLVINKIDLAPYVEVDLEKMKLDTESVRGDKPYLLTDALNQKGIDQVVEWIQKYLLFADIEEGL